MLGHDLSVLGFGVGGFLDHGGDGIGGIAFEAVIDEDEGFAVWGGSAMLDELGAGLAGFGEGFAGLVIGLEGLDGLGVFASGFEEEACGDEVGVGDGVRELELFVDGRHGVPGVVDVGDVVFLEAGEVVGDEPVAVTDFDTVGPVGRELGEEGIEIGEEIASLGVVSGPEAGEFEDDEADLAADLGAGFEEARGEEVGVEEVGVGLAGARAEAFEVGEFADCDGVGDFESELEVWGDLFGEVGEVLGSGEVVISGVDTDCGEGFGIFREAVFFEAGFGVVTAVDIAVAGVDLVEPALVFPAGGAEVDALLGEGVELGLEELAGGGHGVEFRSFGVSST
ncbi:MAG: hypothetical protein RI897_4075 [Verrucomicrobiota bacterium]